MTATLCGRKRASKASFDLNKGDGAGISPRHCRCEDLAGATGANRATTALTMPPVLGLYHGAKGLSRHEQDGWLVR